MLLGKLDTKRSTLDQAVMRKKNSSFGLLKIRSTNTNGAQLGIDLLSKPCQKCRRSLPNITDLICNNISDYVGKGQADFVTVTVSLRHRKEQKQR